MKLASYNDGSRDGQLVVVSRDLAHAHYATGIASRLQQVLDDWNFMSPQLEDLSTRLNQGRARHAFAFEPEKCMAPLPRASQAVHGVAWQQHLNLLDAVLPTPLERVRGEPLLEQLASDAFWGAKADAVFAEAAWDIDFEAGLAVITGDVALGCSPPQALEGVRLLMLGNRWALRALLPGAPGQPVRGGALLHGRPGMSFSPVAVTPDELGESWQGGRVHLPLQASLNGRKVGSAEAGNDMSFHFGQLIAHAARSRPLRAGCIVSAGPVSNKE
ncbi:fumarylacetoacetate hydrolase family protein, partial [Ideonella sp.]|uniref:fumarylacetoacetate hydrolase family protein n=1 Tax=Ideonella sp. TaxID=1929293 RepID=UPI003BB80107